MSDLLNKNLYFFDKNGESLNFQYVDYQLLDSEPSDWSTHYYDYYTYDKSTNTYNNISVYRDFVPYEYYEKMDYWYGVLYLDDVSTGLFSTQSILILESEDNENFYYPKVNKITNEWLLSWDNDDVNEIMLFTYNKKYVNLTQTSLSQEPNGPDIIKVDKLSIPLQHNNVKEAVQINIALNSKDENTFKRRLFIGNDDNQTVNVVIDVIGKTIGEDERLRTLCENLGYKIIDTDSTAFEATDINEILPDWQIINEKRKEILLEGHNIMPYIGAYKAIINVIKYFGYNELQLREFWRNVDPNSDYYGKYLQADCINFLSVDNVRFNQPKVSLPSKQYRKTSLFALVYKINDITPDAYDEDNLPLTHENQSYTQEEILIKLFALKRKLEKDFLPLNARIIDIIGEADFFNLNELTGSISRNIKNDINVGVSADFAVANGLTYNDLNKWDLNIVDLRTFMVDFFNSTENLVNDQPLGVDNYKRIVGEDFLYLVNWWNMFVAPHEKYSLVYDNELVTLKSLMENSSANHDFDVNFLKDTYAGYFNRYNPNLKFSGYTSEEMAGKVLPDVDTLPDNWDFYTDLTLDDNKVAGQSDGSMEIINKNERVPSGALAVLRNTTFEQTTWDNIGCTYNELSKGNYYEKYTFGFTNYTQYTKLNNGVEQLSDKGERLHMFIEGSNFDIEHITTDHDTIHNIMKDIYLQCVREQMKGTYPINNQTITWNDESSSITISGIDIHRIKWEVEHVLPKGEELETDLQYSYVTKDKNVIENLYTWNTVDLNDIIGIEWTIYKEESDNSPYFYFNSYKELGDRDIKKYNELPIILPYVGKYSVEMKLFDMYNNMSTVFKEECIEVLGKEVELNGWYAIQEESNTFWATKRKGLEGKDYSDSEIEHTDDDVLEYSEINSLRSLKYWKKKPKDENRINKYNWNSCGKYKLCEYGSTWDNPLKPDTTWNDGQVAIYDGLDNANFIENNWYGTPNVPFNGDLGNPNTSINGDINMLTTNWQPNDEISIVGAYSWDNTENGIWNDTKHLNWDSSEVSGDRPFVLEINPISKQDLLNNSNLTFTEKIGNKTTTYDLVDNVSLDDYYLIFKLKDEYYKQLNVEPADWNEYDQNEKRYFYKKYGQYINVTRDSNGNMPVFIENRYYEYGGNILQIPMSNLFNIRLYDESESTVVDNEINLLMLLEIITNKIKISGIESLEDFGITFDNKGLLLPNAIYEDGDYDEVIVDFITATKRYVNKSQTQKSYYKIKDEGDQLYSVESCTQQDLPINQSTNPVIKVDYLKQISDCDYMDEQGIIKDEFSNENTIKSTKFIAGNWYYLKPCDHPTYDYTIIDYGQTLEGTRKGVERYLIDDGNIKDIPESMIDDNGNVKTYIGSMDITPWKYYKHPNGNKVPSFIEGYEYYTYDKNGVLTFTPTRYPILDESLYETTTDIEYIKQHIDSIHAYKVPIYVMVDEYDYYEPCIVEFYEMENYEMTKIDPLPNSNPAKIQLVGKYNSHSCDLIDEVVVGYFTTILDDETNEEIEQFIVNEYVTDKMISIRKTQIHNPTWNDVSFINEGVILPKMTRVCLTYDKSRILGKRKPIWTIKKENSTFEKVVQGKYLNYVFKERGNYTICLGLEDSNTNKYYTEKNYIIIK